MNFCGASDCSEPRVEGRTLCGKCYYKRRKARGVDTPMVETDGDTGKAVSRKFTDEELSQIGADLLEPELLHFWGLDPAEWRIVDGSLKASRRYAENAKGEPSWSHQYAANIEKIRPDDEPEPVIERAGPITITNPRKARSKARASHGRELTVIHLDAQIGYWQDHEGEWHTTHDEAAIDLDLQITEYANETFGVDRQVDVGDLIDLPMLSTHSSAPAVVTVPALNKATERAATLLAQMGQHGGDLHWIMGNHEERLTRYLTKNAPELVGITVAGSDKPVLSVGYLTGAEELGWQLHGPYPDGYVWLNHNTKVEHGHVAKGTAGATADTYLKEEVNRFYGHTTRAATVYRDIPRGTEDVRTFVTAGGGGRMKIDGAVPDGGGVNEFGEPGRGKPKPWHQGMILVWTDKEGETVPEANYVSFYGGKAFFQGREFQARCTPNGETLGSE